MIETSNRIDELLNIIKNKKNHHVEKSKDQKFKIKIN